MSIVIIIDFISNSYRLRVQLTHQQGRYYLPILPHYTMLVYAQCILANKLIGDSNREYYTV